MKDNQLIPLFEIINNDVEIALLHSEYDFFIGNFNEFKQFLQMQSKYYPRGILRKQLSENIANYASSVTITSLMKKMGEGVIKEHVSDDGTTYYSLGDPEG